ncbi:MAG: FG-GAP-like repeat-containing protein [Bacteroidota bacterium]
MKHLGSLSLAFILLLPLPLLGETQDSVFVTFLANTSTVPDTLTPSSFVQVRGSVETFGPWNLSSQAILTNIGGDYWIGTYRLHVGDTIQYKFFTNVNNPVPSDAQNTGWEANIAGDTGNRSLIVGPVDTVLPLQYVNGFQQGLEQYWRPYPEPSEFIAVMFRVNMSSQPAFDKNTQFVGVRGGTAPLSWEMTNLVLTRENQYPNGATNYDGTNFWSGVAEFPAEVFTGEVQYKFVILDGPGQEATVLSWEGTILSAPDVYPDGNRFIAANPSRVDTTLFWKFWENRPPAGAILGEYIPDANTQLLLHLNETSGAEVIDASGYGNNGSATGTSVIGGRFGNAKGFEGTAHISIPPSPSIFLGDQNYTMEMWAKSPVLSQNGMLIQKEMIHSTPGFHFFIGGAGSLQGRIIHSFWDGTHPERNIFSRSRVDDLRWHHVAVAKSGSMVSMFVDGILEARIDASEMFGIGNSEMLTVGWSLAGCAVDELRISQIARSPQEFNLQLPPRNLVAEFSGGVVNLNWENGGGAVPVQLYKIYRGLDSTNMSLLYSTASTSIPDGDATSGIAYYYRVSAVDVTGFEGKMSYAASTESVLRLPPYSTSSQYLNDQIAADAGRPANRVYELERGGIYLVNSQISNPGWTLRIHADNSEVTQKPVVMLYPPANGISPGPCIDVLGNVELKNLSITGYYEVADTNLRNTRGGLIAIQSGTSGWRIDIDGCILSNSTGNHIRTDGAASVIRVTNTIFANMGYLGKSNLGAGKAIDVRANPIDSLIIQNCTFVNWQDRIIRHYNGTNPSGPIGYLLFDHNTLVNGMSFHGMLSLGTLGGQAIITNNLLVNPFALGEDADATRQVEFAPSGERDAFGGNRMTWILSIPDFTTQWTISNNYHAITADGQGFYNENAAAGVTGEGSPLTWHINSRLGADSVNAFRKVSVQMSNVPALMLNLMRWYRSPSGGNKTKNTPGAWVYGDVNVHPYSDPNDYDRKGYEYLQWSLNCSYRTSETPVSNDGQTVGDTRWTYLGSLGTLAIQSPNGLDAWMAGTQHDITWTSTGVNTATLLYTTNGTSWDIIASGIPASQGSYTWTVPDGLSAVCRILIRDDEFTNVDDWSDAYFTIYRGGSMFTPVPGNSGIRTVSGQFSCAWGDYDADGDLDVFIAGSAQPNVLYRNNGEGFTDVTATAGLSAQFGWNSGTWGDIDHDGDLDLFIAGHGIRLFRNDGGLFVDITAESHLEFVAIPNVVNLQVALGDYDRDGDLDLALAGGNGVSLPILILRNDAGVFSDVAASMGVAIPLESWNPAWVDVDGDGDLDLWMPTIRNTGQGCVLLINQNGQFVRSNPNSTGIHALSAITSSWGDYNNDQRMDLFVIPYSGDNDGNAKLYHNEGGGTFTEVSQSMGLNQQFAGSRGTAWGDYDNDGDLDLLVGSRSSNTLQKLYRNDQSTFVEVGQETGVGVLGSFRSAVFVDFDNDGFLDIYFNEGYASGYPGISKLLLHNQGTPNHWFGAKLLGTTDNAAGIGARITVKLGPLSKIRDIQAGAGGMTQGDLWGEFGLGPNPITDGVYIQWPGGQVDKHINLPGNQYYTFMQGPAPQGFSAIAGDEKILLRWNRNTNEDFAHYKVYRVPEGGTYALITTLTSISDTSNMQSSLVNGQRYTYMVSAATSSSIESYAATQAIAVPVSVHGDRSVLLTGTANIRIPASPDVGSAVTVEAWIYPMKMTGPDGVIFRRFTPDLSDPFLAYSLHLHQSTPGNQPTLMFQISDGTPGSVVGVSSGPTTIPFFAWTHVAGVYTGSQLQVYVNGALVGQAAAPSIDLNGGQVRMGVDVAPATTSAFFGFIDEVRHWGVVRNESEILAGMGGIDLAGQLPELIGYWKFEEIQPENLSPIADVSSAQTTGEYRVSATTQLFTPFEPAGGTPSASVLPNPVDFGFFEPNEPNIRMMHVTNSGTAKLVGFFPPGGAVFLEPGADGMFGVNPPWYVDQNSPGSPIVLASQMPFINNSPASPVFVSVTGTPLQPKKFDANNISMSVRRTGQNARDALTNNSGLEYPKGSGKFSVYAAGLWLGAQINGVPTIGVAHYNSEYRAGPAVGGTPVDPSNPRYRVYKISRGDNSANSADYASWPADLGAPVNSDGTPRLLGDQTLFSVYNDLSPQGHFYGSAPLGAEVQQTTFGFDEPGALDNTVFLHFKIINRGNQQWTNAYASLWSDPDLGDATDDLIGSDAPRDLAYVYNGRPNDAQYGNTPPAVGYVYLSGALPGKPLRTFTYHTNGDPRLNDPSNPMQFYFYMQGLNRDGNSYIDPTTGQPTIYPLGGNPLNGTGWVDQNPADRRFVLNSGPFDLPPGGSTEVTLAIVVGQGTDNRNSIVSLAHAVDQVRQFHANGGVLIPPVSWTFSSNTGKNATIGVNTAINPKIGTQPLRSGDAVGVFYDRDGQLMCGGYGIWQEGRNLAVTAWGDDPQTPEKDGFAEGEVLRFKAWDGQAGNDYNAQVAFQSGGTVYQTNGIYVLSYFHGVTTVDHAIVLNPGWNMVSSNVTPRDAMIEVLFSSVRDNMVLMKNGAGQVYWPSFGVNQIGNWNDVHGYQIYMLNKDTLDVIGNLIAPQNTPMSLAQGWSLTSYLRSSPLQADLALQSILNNLVLAKNNNGQVFWPSFGINNIGDMRPGEGYQLYLSQASTLTYPANASLPKAAGSFVALPEPEHFKVLNPGTGANAVALVRSNELKDLDEIGIWCSSQLVGAGVMVEGRALVTIWSDNAVTTETVEGAKESEKLVLQAWSRAEGKTKKINPVSVTDGLTGKDAKGEIVFVQNSVLVIQTKVEQEIPTEFSLAQNYPNPFNPATVIEFGLPQDSRVTLEIFNLLGQVVSQLIPGVDFKAGYHKISFEARTLPSGIYVYRVRAGDFVQAKKMLLLR